MERLPSKAALRTTEAGVLLFWGRMVYQSSVKFRSSETLALLINVLSSTQRPACELKVKGRCWTTWAGQRDERLGGWGWLLDPPEGWPGVGAGRRLVPWEPFANEDANVWQVTSDSSYTDPECQGTECKHGSIARQWWSVSVSSSRWLSLLSVGKQSSRGTRTKL